MLGLQFKEKIRQFDSFDVKGDRNFYKILIYCILLEMKREFKIEQIDVYSRKCQTRNNYPFISKWIENNSDSNIDSFFLPEVHTEFYIFFFPSPPVFLIVLVIENYYVDVFGIGKSNADILRLIRHQGWYTRKYATKFITPAMQVSEFGARGVD